MLQKEIFKKLLSSEVNLLCCLSQKLSLSRVPKICRLLPPWTICLLQKQGKQTIRTHRDSTIFPPFAWFSLPWLLTPTQTRQLNKWTSLSIKLSIENESVWIHQLLSITLICSALSIENLQDQKVVVAGSQCSRLRRCEVEHHILLEHRGDVLFSRSENCKFVKRDEILSVYLWSYLMMMWVLWGGAWWHKVCLLSLGSMRRRVFSRLTLEGL
jgi:hypothetical protein